MYETKKLFYEDAYRKEFSARVLCCEENGGRYQIILDQTLFYPEGGGQPGDTGFLDQVKIEDTREKNGEILHIATAPLSVGDTVGGRIDWPRRFLLMQQHTGEHILSGLVNRLYRYDNVGFHMGGEFVTVDFHGDLSTEDCNRLEALANEAVYRNLPVSAAYPGQDELNAMDYRSKKELLGRIRIVTVPEYDQCACCGLHTARTGEVGMIKILSAQRYKGGARLTLTVGRRALEDYGAKARDVAAISSLLSARQAEVVAAVRRLLAERDAGKQEMQALRDRLFSLRAQSVPEGSARACMFEEEMQPGELRAFCLHLCERAEVAAVFSKSGGEWKYALGSKSADMRAAAKRLNGAFQGRGGGKPELVQGSLATGSREDLERFAGSI